MTRLDGPNMKPSDRSGSKPNFTDKQDALVTNSCPSSSQHVSEVPQKGWTRPQRNVAKLSLRGGGRFLFQRGDLRSTLCATIMLWLDRACCGGIYFKYESGQLVCYKKRPSSCAPDR